MRIIILFGMLILIAEMNHKPRKIKMLEFKIIRKYELLKKIDA